MKRAYYLPLTIAILFGLTITLISSSPVYGDNVPGCQGTGNSTAKVILGGRVITPSTILRTANGQPCDVNETSLNLIAVARTLVVSPNGTPVQNGTALLSAMNTISNASPSSSNPWLLKLEPGNYDLGSQALTLIPFVDLEGSGEGTTTISSTVASPSFPPTQGTLIMASNSEARFVKVVNSGAGYKQIGVLVSSGVSNARLFHLTANASAPGGSGSYGLFNIGGDVTVQKSTLSASAGPDNTALVNSGGTTLVQNSTLSSSGGSNRGYGLYNEASGTLTVENSSVSGTGTALGYGLYNSNGNSNLQNTTLSGSGTNGYGLANNGGNSTALNSVLTGSGSPTYSIINYGGSINVGASEVTGVNIIGGGTVTCVASYNASFAALSSACA